MRKFINVLTVIFVGIAITSSLYGKEEQKSPKGTLLIVPSPKIQIPTKTKTKGVIFSEDFETGGTSWTVTNGVWEIGAPTYGPDSAHTGNYCAGTNLSGDYPNDAYTQLVSPTIALPTLSRPESKIILDFYHWFELESGYDYGYIQISTDAGSTWTTVGNSVNGSSGSSWYPYSVDLTNYAGQNIKLAFLLSSDYSYYYSGWYIDDITITVQEPEPLNITINSISSELFPFIYLTASVDTFNYPIPTLTQSNFSVYENGVLQTDYFEVTPPDTSGGVRLVDIVFCMDNSGSMSDEQYAVQQNVDAFVDSLSASGINFALGLVRFGASENSGYPIVEDNGQLTSDVNYFKNDVWARNVIDGGFEPGYDALVAGVTGFNFRPGANKILILITDEDVTYEGNSGSYTRQQSLDILRQNSGIVFALIDSTYYYSYTDYGTFAEETNGGWFNITDPMDEILNAISGMVGGTYIVRYRSNNTTPSGQREVVLKVDYSGDIDEDTTYYTPGSAPQIVLTEETESLMDSSIIAGTNISVKAYITDNVLPYLKSATLFYRSTGTGGYSSVGMTNISDSTYEGIIPGSAVDTIGVDFYITATDSVTTTSLPASQPSEHPFQFAVWPNYSPRIHHTPVYQASVGQDIPITAYVVDNTHYVDTVKLFYRETGTIDYSSILMTNTSDSTYTATIPGAVFNDNGVDYYIYAEDDLGLGTYHGTNGNPHSIYRRFEVTRDGWGFPNFSYWVWPMRDSYAYPESVFVRGRWLHTGVGYPTFPDWAIFDSAFGDEVNLPDGSPRWSAFKYWWKIKGKWGGSCFGFSTSSLLFYSSILNLNNFDFEYQLLQSHVLTNVRSTVVSRNIINKYQLYQYDCARNGLGSTINFPADDWVKKFADTAKVFFSGSPILLHPIALRTIHYSGHAVVGYAIEQYEGYPDSFKLFIYDPNYPSEKKFIILDTRNNKIYYRDFIWAWFLKHPIIDFYLSRPSLPTSPPHLPVELDKLSLQNDAAEGSWLFVDTNHDVLIFNTQGDSLGWVNDSLIDNSNIGRAIIPLDNRYYQRPPQYLVSNEGKTTLKVMGMIDSTYSITLFGSHAIFEMSENNILNGEEDYITWNPLQDTFTLSTTQNNKQYSVEIVVPQQTYEMVTQINRTSIGKEESAYFIRSNEGKSLKYVNLGKKKTYDLGLLKADNSPYSFTKSEIAIDSFASHTIKVSNWQNLDSSIIFIEIDKGNDGTIDDTFYLQGLTPPTKGKLSNENVYAFPNPFNPDKTEATIRFSLSTPANVTIKITDITGHIVTTLRKNEPMNANVEYAIPWNGKNDKGDIVANGIYFYHITTSEGEKAFGKIAVLR